MMEVVMVTMELVRYDTKLKSNSHRQRINTQVLQTRCLSRCAQPTVIEGIQYTKNKMIIKKHSSMNIAS